MCDDIIVSPTNGRPIQFRGRLIYTGNVNAGWRSLYEIHLYSVSDGRFVLETLRHRFLDDLLCTESRTVDICGDPTEITQALDRIDKRITRYADTLLGKIPINLTPPHNEAV